MAVLPLYFIAMPRRRSLARAIRKVTGDGETERGRYINVAHAQESLRQRLFNRLPQGAARDHGDRRGTTKRLFFDSLLFSVSSVSSSERSEREVKSKQFQFREVLRIDDADGDVVVIDDDEIVDAMTLEKVEDFDGELVLVNAHRVERHQIGDEPFADFRVGLKMAREIAVSKDAE